MKLSYVSGKRAVVFCLIFLGLIGCKPHSENTTTASLPPEGQQSSLSRQLLVRGSYEPLTADLAQAHTEEQFQLLRDIAEGLVIVNPQGEITPALAESWSSKDNKSWQFNLREGLYWSNGEPFLAQDIVKSWQQLARSNSPLKQYLLYLNLAQAQAVINGERPVEQLGIIAENDRTLRIELDKATPYLPKMLAHVALLPVYQGQQSPQGVSNGAYQVIQQKPDRILLAKNPYYWNANAVSFSQVAYQKLEPQQSLSNLDLVRQPKQTNEKLHYFDKLCSYYYEFNFNQVQLQQKNIRQALTALLALSTINVPEFALTRHFLPKNLQQVEQENWLSIVAEQLLQQQGISEQNPLSLRLSYDAEGIHSQIAEQMIRMWSQSDLIRIQKQPLSWQQLQQQRNSGDFDIIRSGWCADYNDPAAFFSLLYSHSPDNKMGYANPQLDKLLERLLSQTSPQEITKIYAQLETLVQQDYVLLPLFQYRQAVYLAPSVAGFDEHNPTGFLYSKDLYRRVVQ